MSHPQNSQVIRLADEAATHALGQRAAQALVEVGSSTPWVLYLKGGLGAGKTALMRSFIQGLGYEGRVKSPTYTLMEPYRVAKWSIYHYDLYRLGCPDELIHLGVEDQMHPGAILAFEWPSQAGEWLPDADCVFDWIEIDEARTLEITAHSEKALEWLNRCVAN